MYNPSHAYTLIKLYFIYTDVLLQDLYIGTSDTIIRWENGTYAINLAQIIDFTI